jgi:hypothetical protein
MGHLFRDQAANENGEKRRTVKRRGSQWGLGKKRRQVGIQRRKMARRP